jgi:hypothetical protein
MINQIIVMNPGDLRDLISEAVAIALNNQVQSTSTKSIHNYLNTVEAAAYLSKTPNALRVMLCKNQIKSIKKSGTNYFLESDLIDWLESGRRKTLNELKENCEDVLVQKKKGASRS